MATGTLERTAAEAVAAALSEQDQYRVLCLLHRAGGTTEREDIALRELFTTEVADALARSWDLMSDGGLLMPPLTEQQARQLAFHAVARLQAIRRRDHIDPIF